MAIFVFCAVTVVIHKNNIHKLVCISLEIHSNIAYLLIYFIIYTIINTFKKKIDRFLKVRGYK